MGNPTFNSRLEYLAWELCVSAQNSRTVHKDRDLNDKENYVEKYWKEYLPMAGDVLDVLDKNFT
jgi:hypothetical protein